MGSSTARSPGPPTVTLSSRYGLRLGTLAVTASPTPPSPKPVPALLASPPCAPIAVIVWFVVFGATPKYSGAPVNAYVYVTVWPFIVITGDADADPGSARHPNPTAAAEMMSLNARLGGCSACEQS